MEPEGLDDTESMSEGCYRALLCLVGVIVADEDGAPQVELMTQVSGSTRSLTGNKQCEHCNAPDLWF